MFPKEKKKRGNRTQYTFKGKTEENISNLEKKNLDSISKKLTKFQLNKLKKMHIHNQNKEVIFYKQNNKRENKER